MAIVGLLCGIVFGAAAAALLLFGNTLVRVLVVMSIVGVSILAFGGLDGQYKTGWGLGLIAAVATALIGAWYMRRVLVR